MVDPLFHPGWIEFNESQWSLKAEKLVFGPDRGSAWELKTIKLKCRTAIEATYPMFSGCEICFYHKGSLADGTIHFKGKEAGWFFGQRILVSHAAECK
jgi:hypothetical protein